MAKLDRFSEGLQDPQSMEPEEVERCTYHGCQNPIYKGEKNWDLDGEWFCSAICLARYMGARKVVTTDTW